MIKRNEKDFWIEMSIREIWTQAHFAEIAYQNIDPKAKKGTDAIFSSIHSFLSHCSNVSKMLKATDRRKTKINIINKIWVKLITILNIQKKAIVIGDILGISANSPIHNRKFRNHLEHYDERLKQWIGKFAAGASIGTYTIGPKTAIKSKNMIFVSHYDPTDKTFTFVNEDFDLSILYKEVERIKGIADKWISLIQFEAKKPPFDQ